MATGSGGGGAGRQPKLVNLFTGEDNSRSRHRTVFVGGTQDTTKRNDVVLLLIAHCADFERIQLIDSLCNYFYGAKIDDDTRFHIADEKFDVSSPNADVVTYLFHGTVMPFRPIIVDASSIKREDWSLADWLLRTQQEPRLATAYTLFVFPAASRFKEEPRLYFEAALRALPQDLVDRISVLLTNCDGSPPPAGLLRWLGLDENTPLLKFNSAAVFEAPQDDALREYLRTSLWRMMDRNFRTLVNHASGQELDLYEEVYEDVQHDATETPQQQQRPEEVPIIGNKKRPSKDGQSVRFEDAPPVPPPAPPPAPPLPPPPAPPPIADPPELPPRYELPPADRRDMDQTTRETIQHYENIENLTTTFGVTSHQHHSQPQPLPVTATTSSSTESPSSVELRRLGGPFGSGRSGRTESPTGDLTPVVSTPATVIRGPVTTVGGQIPRPTYRPPSTEDTASTVISVGQGARPPALTRYGPNIIEGRNEGQQPVVELETDQAFTRYVFDATLHRYRPFVYETTEVITEERRLATVPEATNNGHNGHSHHDHDGHGRQNGDQHYHHDHNGHHHNGGQAPVQPELGRGVFGTPNYRPREPLSSVTVLEATTTTTTTTIPAELDPRSPVSRQPPSSIDPHHRRPTIPTPEARTKPQVFDLPRVDYVDPSAERNPERVYPLSARHYSPLPLVYHPQQPEKRSIETQTPDGDPRPSVLLLDAAAQTPPPARRAHTGVGTDAPRDVERFPAATQYSPPIGNGREYPVQAAQPINEHIIPTALRHPNSPVVVRLHMGPKTLPAGVNTGGGRIVATPLEQLVPAARGNDAESQHYAPLHKSPPFHNAGIPQAPVQSAAAPRLPRSTEPNYFRNGGGNGGGDDDDDDDADTDFDNGFGANGGNNGVGGGQEPRRGRWTPTRRPSAKKSPITPITPHQAPPLPIKTPIHGDDQAPLVVVDRFQPIDNPYPRYTTYEPAPAQRTNNRRPQEGKPKSTVAIWYDCPRLLNVCCLCVAPIFLGLAVIVILVMVFAAR